MPLIPVTAVLLASLVTTAELPSQTIVPNPGAADVAALLRGYGRHGPVVSVLTQALRPQPQQKLDEIAETLVVIAVSLRGNDLRGSRTRGAALRALLLSGIGSSGVVGIDHAVPYAGAADRLMTIAETAEDVGIQGTALWALTRLPNKTGLFPFLQQVASSQSRVAYRALTLLANETGPEGQAIARDLYQGHKVTQPLAKETLDHLAWAYGWR